MATRERSSVPDWLFRTLQKVGLRVEPGQTPSTVAVHLDGCEPIKFDILNFPVLSLERAREVAGPNRVQNSGKRLLLASRQLSARTREMLRTDGLSWAEELTGVCHLVGPGLLVDVGGSVDLERRPESPARARLRDRSGLLAEALLMARPEDRIHLRTIAKRAQVSTALASRVLNRLSKINLIQTHNAGPNRYWQLVDRGGLLDLWATEEHQRPEETTGLYVWSRSPQGLFEKLPLINHLTERWAFGGPAAANSYAPTLTTYPDPTVWVDARIPPEDVARTLQGEIVDKGSNLQLWQSERNLALELANLLKPSEPSSLPRNPELRVVSKPRAYIEAVGGAGRSPEIAQNLRERILGNDSD